MSVPLSVMALPARMTPSQICRRRLSSACLPSLDDPDDAGWSADDQPDLYDRCLELLGGHSRHYPATRRR
ncbi:MAG TPA: hypothetical protein VGL77_18340 [Armatimonadota bacterium]